MIDIGKCAAIQRNVVNLSSHQEFRMTEAESAPGMSQLESSHKVYLHPFKNSKVERYILSVTP